MRKSQKCWKDWAEALRMTMMQGRVPEVVKSVEIIKQETGTTESLQSLKSTRFWNAYRDGKADSDTLVRAGFVIHYKPNEAGGVEEITFELNKVWRDIMDKAVARQV